MLECASVYTVYMYTVHYIYMYMYRLEKLTNTDPACDTLMDFTIGLLVLG